MPAFEMAKHAEQDQKFHANIEELLGMGIPSKDFIHLFPLFSGWVNLARYLCLYELYKMTRGVLGHLCEIGTWKGASFIFLAKLVQIFEPHSTTQVHGFDWFAGMKYDAAQDKTDHQGMYAADQATLERLVRMQGLHNTAILHSMDVTTELGPFIEAHPMQKCTILVEQPQYVNLGVSYLTAVLKRQGYPVQVFFDDYGFKPWIWGGGQFNTA